MRKCSSCDGEAVKGKKFCAGCRAKIDAQKARTEANIRWWNASDGTKKEAPIPKFYPKKETIFSAGTPPLQADDPIGEFLKVMIGICFKRPEYVRRGSAARYIALVNEFGNSALQSPWDRAYVGHYVADLPIHLLGMALGDWVSSTLKEPRHPMMPNYVLDAARFIELHAGGYDGGFRESWRLDPLVATESPKCDTFSFLCPRFKKEFTERTPALLCVGTVPPRARIQWRETVIGEGTLFLFGFQRCYLSENINDYYTVQARCDDPGGPDFNLMDEFRFTGDFHFVKLNPDQYMAVTGGDALAAATEFYRLHRDGKVIPVGGRLPGDWITDVVGFEDDGTMKSLPVPHWEAEFDR